MENLLQQPGESKRSMTHMQEPNFPLKSISGADELGQYRSLSTLALAAFVLGLLSPLVFVSALLVVVPLAAVATAWLALRKISSSLGGLSGAGLARCGLALAIFFSAAAATRVSFRNELFRRQADATAQQWLSLVSSGRTEEAASWMTNAALARLGPSPIPGQMPPPIDHNLAAVQLRQDPLIRLLVQQQVDLTFVRHRAVTASNSGGERVQCTYKVTNAQAEPSLLTIAVRRFKDVGRGPVWLVEKWSAELPSSSQVEVP